MSRRAFIILSLAAVLILSVCAPGFSGERKSSFFAGAGWADHGAGQLKGAVQTDFGFSLNVTKKISLFLDFCYWKSPVDQQAQSVLLAGDVILTPLLGGIRFDPLPGGFFSPYLFGGIGYVVSTYRMGEIFSIPEVTIMQKLKSGIGFQGGAGVMFRISESIGLFVEGLFIGRNATGTTTVRDLNLGLSSEDFSLNLNTLTVRVGLKYFVGS
jgi:hypothetical protein